MVVCYVDVVFAIVAAAGDGDEGGGVVVDECSSDICRGGGVL